MSSTDTLNAKDFDKLMPARYWIGKECDMNQACCFNTDFGQQPSESCRRPLAAHHVFCCVGALYDANKRWKIRRCASEKKQEVKSL